MIIDANGVILKNNTPRYLVIDFSKVEHVVASVYFSPHKSQVVLD